MNEPEFVYWRGEAVIRTTKSEIDIYYAKVYVATILLAFWVALYITAFFRSRRVYRKLRQ